MIAAISKFLPKPLSAALAEGLLHIFISIDRGLGGRSHQNIELSDLVEGPRSDRARSEFLRRQQLLIRSLLQRIPWWWRGHYRLGWLALRERDLELATLCALAVHRLGRDSRDPISARGSHLYGAVLVAAGDRSAKTERLLQEALNVLPNNSEIAEDLAAHLAAVDRKDEALKLLISFRDRLSAEGRSMLNFLESGEL